MKSFKKKIDRERSIVHKTFKAAKILFFMLLIFVSDQHPLVLLIDETLGRRRGKKIKAKGYFGTTANRLGAPVLERLHIS